MRRENSILDSIVMLALIGILAGVIGGFGVGLITKSTSSSSSSSSSTGH